MISAPKNNRFLFLLLTLGILGCSSSTQKKAQDLSRSIEKDLNQTGKKAEKIGQDLGKKSKKLGNEIGDGTKKGLHELQKTGDTLAHKLKLKD